MNFSIIKTLTQNTITKEYRNKGLFFIFIFTLAIITLANMLLNFVNANFSFGEFVEVGNKGFFIMFFVISSISTITSIILGLNCVRSDFESSSISQVLSFPIRRIEFLISRVLGAWLIALAFFLVSIGFTVILFSLKTEGSFINGSLFFATLAMSANMLTLITISALISLYVPKLFGFILLMILRSYTAMTGAYLMGQASDTLFSDLSFMKVINLVFYFFFPRLQVMDSYSKAFLEGASFDIDSFAFFSHYFVTFIILFSIFGLLFSRKDL
jgi:ABC-type transport system involved in multi-copper enzyme maturation permease subunit